jgi:hypothetical protein
MIISLAQALMLRLLHRSCMVIWIWIKVAIWVWYSYKIKFTRKITPRNWNKAPSRHALSIITTAWKIDLVALLLIQVLFKLEQIYIRLVICFPHRRLSSFLNIDHWICCTVPDSLQLRKQCIPAAIYCLYNCR